MKSKYLTIAAMFSFVFGLTACSNKENAPESRPAKVKVRVLSVKPVEASGNRLYSGTIEEVTGTTLSFSVAGTVRQLHVSTGQKVAKGALIASLDESSLRNAHNASVAMLEQATDAYNRMKLLHDNNSLPEIQWVEVQSKLKQAQSAEQIARKNLTDGKLYAPFSGVISEKMIEQGQNVMPGMPVAKLVSISQVKVNIPVPEKELSKVKTGDMVTITVPALDDKSFTGKIVEKGVDANPLSRSYEVKAVIDNPGGELVPGMICTLSSDMASGRNIAAVIPANIVQIDEHNKTFVWITRNGKAVKREIKVGAITDNGITVMSGLSFTDNVIVEGQQKVSEGTEVTIEK